MVDSGLPELLSTVNQQPFDAYDRMRQEPVRWDASMGGWVVSSYELCKQVLRGDNTLCRHADADNRAVITRVTGAPRHMSFMTGEDHRRLHRWWLRLFSPTAMARYRQTVVAPIVRDTVDRLEDAGHADLHTDFAARIPPRVIAAITGLPWQDDDWIRQLKSLLDRLGDFFDRRPGADHVEADAVIASAEVTAMLLPAIRSRRAGAGNDDIISAAWRDGPALLPDWDETDVLGMVRTMFLAGTDTTSHSIANAVHLLLTRPEMASQIRADEALEPAFGEEVLRLLGPAHFRVRKANEDFEAGGMTVRKGDKVFPLLAAANRDPGQYPNPHDFELDRHNLRDHVAFNFGPRTCVGAALARSEIQESVHALLHRLPNLRLDPTAAPPKLQGFAVRSYTPLPVTFDPPAPGSKNPMTSHDR